MSLVVTQFQDLQLHYLPLKMITQYSLPTSFVLVMFIFPQCLNFLCHAAFKRSSWISLSYLFNTVWYHENF